MGKAYFCDVGHGDCTVIQANSGTYLMDCHEIHRYSHLLPASKRLRGVFITHQHRDHFSGLNYLKDNGYAIDFLIYSPYERRYGDNSAPYDEWQEFESLRNHFVNRGTKTRTPYRQDSFDKAWWKAGDVNFWMLGPFQDIACAGTRELHDACLVVKVHAGSRKFLITGDASDCSLNRLAKNTTHFCDDILRASHHGSINGADLDFVKGANAAYTVVSTKPGVFPNVPHPTAMQRYRDNTRERVYRTDQDGTINWDF